MENIISEGMEELRNIIDMVYKALPRQEFIEKISEITTLMIDTLRVYGKDIVDIKKRLDEIEIKLKL